MARKTARNFLADFAALDIEYLPGKGPEVSDDIQMVYGMGDVNRVIPGWTRPDPVLTEYGVFFFQGPVVAERGRIELLAPPGGGGIWIEMMLGTNTIIDTVFFSLNALSGLATTLNPTSANSGTFGDGVDATVVVERGTTATVAPANAWRGGTGPNASAWGGPRASHSPIYLSPGRVFVAQAFQLNLGLNWGVVWRELP